MVLIKSFLIGLFITNILVIGIVSASFPDNINQNGQRIDSIKGTGSDYALVIGIANYENTDIFPKLDAPAVDAENVWETLVNNCGFPSSNVLVLLDQQATKENIHSVITQFNSKIGPVGKLVVYFSGHGTLYPVNTGTAYLVTYDSTYYTNTLISSDELKSWLDTTQSNQVIVITDSCHSGGMIRDSSLDNLRMSQGGNSSDSEQFMDSFIGSFKNGNGSTEQKKGITGSKYLLLMACRFNEVSNEIPAGGFFTTCLMNGIKSGATDSNNDKWISAEEAFNYASPLVTEIISKVYSDNQHPQMYDGNPGTDIGLRYIGPDTPSVGKVYVNSTPSGAKIFLDGTDTGFVTPKTLTGITAGSHNIQCTKNGYNNQSQVISVSADQTTNLLFTLPQIQQAGYIAVNSTPSGAKIFLDGPDTGFVTPKTLTGITAGSHNIQCTKNGYNNQSQVISVSADQTINVPVHIAPDPAGGIYRG